MKDIFMKLINTFKNKSIAMVDHTVNQISERIVNNVGINHRIRITLRIICINWFIGISLYKLRFLIGLLVMLKK